MSRDPSNEVEIVLDEEMSVSATASVAEDVIDEKPAANLPKGAVLNPNGTVTLKLAAPVSLKTRNSAGVVTETVYDSFTLRRFNGADQRAIRQLTGDAMTIEMFARAANVRNPVMNALYDRMDAYDIGRIGEVIEYFFLNGPISTGS